MNQGNLVYLCSRSVASKEKKQENMEEASRHGEVWKNNSEVMRVCGGRGGEGERSAQP